jgi:putative Holliday junction resolvase
MIFTETRILAIDFGIKRIGLALSDPLKTFAYPFNTLTNDAKFFSKLTNLIHEKEIVKIILGLPEADNKRTLDIKNKILQLKQRIEKLNIEVVLWDEMFTSAIASEKILQSVTKKSKRQNKGLIDQQAAAIILQEYLDSNVNTVDK